MSYPRCLDEYTEEELRTELERRAKLRADHKCDYCGRSVHVPVCRFPERHQLRTTKLIARMTTREAARTLAGIVGMPACQHEGCQDIATVEVGDMLSYCTTHADDRPCGCGQCGGVPVRECS